MNKIQNRKKEHDKYINELNIYLSDKEKINNINKLFTDFNDVLKYKTNINETKNIIEYFIINIELYNHMFNKNQIMFDYDKIEKWFKNIKLKCKPFTNTTKEDKETYFYNLKTKFRENYHKKILELILL